MNWQKKASRIFRNPGWLERLKKRNGTALKNVCDEANVLPIMTVECLQSTLSTMHEEYDSKDFFKFD